MIVTFDEQPTEEDLEHFGIKGMKWGVRRYENEDARTEEQVGGESWRCRTPQYQSTMGSSATL